MNFDSKRPLRMRITAAIFLGWICFYGWGAGIVAASEQAPESRFATLNGHKIHYTVEGKGQNSLLFVHGWSCDVSAWRFQIPAFKNDYKVVAVDLPGHGKSDKPRIAYTQRLFADALKAVVDDAEIDKVFLIGHSMGFPVSELFMRSYPDRAIGLCNVDGAYLRIPENPENKAKFEKELQVFADLFKGESRKEFLQSFLDSMFVPQSPPELKEEIKKLMLGAQDYVANSAIDEMFKLHNWDEHSLSAPALAVYAVSDDLPPDNEAYLRRWFPDTEYHLWEETGHFLMMERPERFNEVLHRFLSSRFPG